MSHFVHLIPYTRRVKRAPHNPEVAGSNPAPATEIESELTTAGY
jgi:hypothetical protein